MILHSPAVLTKKAIPTTAEIVALTNAVSGWSGVVCDPTNLANLFQLSGGSTAVTTVADPVGYCADVSGNIRHATQATAGNRPAYNRINEARGLLFDGTSDTLTYNTTALMQNKNYGVMIVAARFPATGAVGRLIHVGTGASTTRMALDKNASDVIAVSGRKLDADSSSALSLSPARSVVDGWHVYTAEHDYVNNLQILEIDNNGRVSASAATWDTGGTVTSNTASTVVQMGALATGNYFSGYLGRHIFGSQKLPREVMQAAKRWAGGGFGAII